MPGRLVWRRSGRSSRGRGRVLQAFRLRLPVRLRTRSRREPGPCLGASRQRPDARGELAEMRPDRGWCGGEQVADQAAHGWAGTNFLRCEFLSGAQGVEGLLVLAPL